MKKLMKKIKSRIRRTGISMFAGFCVLTSSLISCGDLQFSHPITQEIICSPKKDENIIELTLHDKQFVEITERDANQPKIYSILVEDISFRPFEIEGEEILVATLKITQQDANQETRWIEIGANSVENLIFSNGSYMTIFGGTGNSLDRTDIFVDLMILVCPKGYVSETHHI